MATSVVQSPSSALVFQTASGMLGQHVPPAQVTVQRLSGEVVGSFESEEEEEFLCGDLRARVAGALSVSTCRVCLVSACGCLLEDGHIAPPLVTVVVLQPAQAMLACQRELQLWDLCTMTLLSSMASCQEPVTCMAVCFDEHRALVGTAFGLLEELQMDKGAILTSWRAHKHTVECLAVSPSFEWAISGSSDTTLRMWDLSVTPPSSHTELKGHLDGIHAVGADFQSGFAVTAGAERSLIVWSIAACTLRGRLWGHTQRVTDVHVEGADAMTCSEDGTLKRWDLGTMSCLFTCDVPGPFELPSFCRMCASFASSLVVAATQLGAIHFWNSESGEYIGRAESQSPSAEPAERGCWSFAKPITAMRADFDTGYLLALTFDGKMALVESATRIVQSVVDVGCGRQVHGCADFRSL